MSTQRHVTIAMIVAHTGKTVGGVMKALRNARTPMEKIPGVKGWRILEKDANRFIAMQWPQCGPMPVNQLPATILK